MTLVFYDGEEVSDEHNGLRRLFAERPDLVACDMAVLLEPTGQWIEAGCQGTIHTKVTFRGARAHSARPWMGVNAVHRAAPLLARIAATKRRRHGRRPRLPGVAPGRPAGGGDRQQRGARSLRHRREPAVRARLLVRRRARTDQGALRRRRRRRDRQRVTRGGAEPHRPAHPRADRGREPRRAARSSVGPTSRASPSTAFRQSTSARAIQSWPIRRTNASTAPISNTACACCRSSWVSRTDRQIRRCSMTTLP